MTSSIKMGLIYFEVFLLANLVLGLDPRVDPLVLIEQGLVRGQKANDGDYSAFYGIPYAQVDNKNPFGSALPPPQFEGQFIANNDNTECPQLAWQQSGTSGTLDCLKLNIFVPSSANSQNLLPVLLWIHGGGFEGGKGPTTDINPIVKHDIVYVTINYRLGPYGFMCLNHPLVPGNQGLKDQVLAIKWVKENIQAFGGDPKDVTLAGQSAGSAAVNFHLYTKNEKYFNKAIIQSCTAQTTGVYTDADDTVALKISEHLGYNVSDTESALGFLSAAPVDLILAAHSELGLYLRPCKEMDFDGMESFMTTDVFSMTNEEKIRGTPVLIGVTSRELTGWPDVYDVTSFSEVIAKSFDLDEDELENVGKIISHFYLGDQSVDTASESLIHKFQSEFFFTHALEREVTKLYGQSAGPIFEYIFNYQTAEKRETSEGPSHGSEMEYVFYSDSDRLNDEDKAVAQIVNTLWANFIKYGTLLLLAVAASAAPSSGSTKENSLGDSDKNPTTHELLSSLGLKKLRVPAGHHKKRLAEQGRRHATGDSRMFVIKLPPNTSYYTHSDPAPPAARTLPLQMQGNGKPARVYHWNLPVLQKMAKNRPQARFDDNPNIVDVESTPTWPKGHPNSLDALAYYVPTKKTSFRKYFSGNGRPKSFYVIDKSKKSTQYHRLLP